LSAIYQRKNELSAPQQINKNIFIILRTTS
jgi:hypothetical protein